ncbi:hypothetical protein KUTeg_014131 [Tegillarca granosa]|uniref:protein kinase C n=1 Tax=Tegillarca granosa TaxID=220873 RepID=A0ABQ9EZ77_TEGGR|nr:hypothetical protein KUTeg_014131 [Tegillarca granosa]
MEDNKKSLSFQMQIGLTRDQINVDGELTLASLKEIACAFVDRKFPEHGFYGLVDKLLLFRHDSSSPNLLQYISNSSDVKEGCLIEVVLSAQTTMEDLQIRPHLLFVHSYKSPHFCDFCGEMLFGLVKQGLKCEGCGLNFHKRCAFKIPNNCSYDRQRRPSASSISFSMREKPELCSVESPSQVSIRIHYFVFCFGHFVKNIMNFTLAVPGQPSLPLQGEPRSNRSKSWSGRPIWMEREVLNRIKVPHTFAIHNYTRPTICQWCRKLLKGLFRQGVQCQDCKFNCHKKCVPFVPKDCMGDVPIIEVPSDRGESETDSNVDTESTDMTDDISPEDGEEEQDHKPPLSPTQSSNIPLMRIVQSIKHTKRTGSKIKKEGWMRKRHYWRLDSKSVTLFQSESTSRYFKEILLTDIVAIEMAKVQPTDNMTKAPFVFEIRLPSTTYYVGEDPTFGGRQGNFVVSPESGSGLEQARYWEHAIRQALMPVTPTTSANVVGGELFKNDQDIFQY